MYNAGLRLYLVIFMIWVPFFPPIFTCCQLSYTVKYSTMWGARFYGCWKIDVMIHLLVVFMFNFSVSSLLCEQIRSAAKFALYQKFTNSLAIAVLISIAWIGIEVTYFF